MLYYDVKKKWLSCDYGRFAGQGQTSRANKGQIENFQTYH